MNKRMNEQSGLAIFKFENANVFLKTGFANMSKSVSKLFLFQMLRLQLSINYRTCFQTLQLHFFECKLEKI